MPAARVATPGESGHAVVGLGAQPAQPARRHSTPGRLRRLRIVVLATAVLLWITATILLSGLDGTAASVRGTSYPAYLDAIETRAALSDADRAAWQSFRSGAAQLTGPGQQYQNDITTSGQDLEYLDSPGQLNVILHGLDRVR